MSRPSLGHEPDLVVSFDGSPLAARRMGAEEGETLLVVPAVGADLSVWRLVLRRLALEHPVVTWDLRGLHSSGEPGSTLKDPSAHTEDAIAVLDHFDVSTAHVIAWSSGSRIAIELTSSYPEIVTSLGLMNGGYGLSLSRLFRHLEFVSLLPTVAGVGKHFSRSLGAAFRAITGRPEIAGLVRQSGVIGPTADIPALVDLLKGVAACDPKILLATFEAVVGDAAPGLLSEVRCPTLIVAGRRDPFISEEIVADMAAAIPMAQMVWYEQATHYLPLEFPDDLAMQLRSFWEGLRPPRPRPSAGSRP